jgi:hypothetical protein
MRKSIALLLAFMFLFTGAQSVTAAQKTCTETQLVKIYKLAVEFNDNRSYVLKFALNIDRAVAGILKSQGDRDLAAEKLWWQNFNTATSEAKRLTVEENRILTSLKSAFNCSGYGTSLDAQYGFIGIKKNVKTKAWPANVRLTPAPGMTVSEVATAPTALSATEAKDCRGIYKNRIYVAASSFMKDYYRVHKMENMSDCVVFFNVTFDINCPDRNTNSFSNPVFPYTITYKGGYKLEPRKSLEFQEDGFASRVGEQCYVLSKRMPNVVQFQSSPPTIQVTAVNAPEIVLNPSQVVRKNCVVGSNCPVGSKGPGGGIVFYDAGSQQTWGRYLEVAPSGWSGTALDPTEKWCMAGEEWGNFQKNSSSSSVESFLIDEIGAGAKNTDLMIAKCSQGAANLVRKYTGGGKSDWSLPTRQDFNLLWKYQLIDKYLVEGNPTTFWTSTEWGFHYALSHGLAFSVQAVWVSSKADARPVRPVRAF